MPILPPPPAPSLVPGSPLKIPPAKPPRPDSFLTSTPITNTKRLQLESVKMINNILESNSAPNLIDKVIIIIIVIIVFVIIFSCYFVGFFRFASSTL